jgi:membrane protein YdbS with pleckstrin-like domain
MLGTGVKQMEIRQSLKAVKAAYMLCVVLELAAVILWYENQFPASMPFWVIGALPVILAIFAVIRHIQRRMTKITISSDRVHYETGLMSKATRTVELAKVQDVRVSLSLWQRVFNIGNLSLETAGSSSRILMESIDRPQEVANHILDMARAAGKEQFQPRINVNEQAQGSSGTHS